MGEKIKDLGQIRLGENTFFVELNLIGAPEREIQIQTVLLMIIIKQACQKVLAIFKIPIFFVGNDSCLFYIAATGGVKNIINLCNGQHYGCFVYYPDSVYKKKYFFYVIEAKVNKRSDVISKYEDSGYEDITAIKSKKVLKLIDNIFTSQDKEK